MSLYKYKAPSTAELARLADAALAAANAEGLTLKLARQRSSASSGTFSGFAGVVKHRNGSFSAQRLSNKLQRRSAAGERRKQEPRVVLGSGFHTAQEAALAVARDAAAQQAAGGRMTAEEAKAEASRLGLHLEETLARSTGENKYAYICVMVEAGTGTKKYYIHADAAYDRPEHVPPHFNTAEEAALEYARYTAQQQDVAQHEKAAGSASTAATSSTSTSTASTSTASASTASPSTASNSTASTSTASTSTASTASTYASTASAHAQRAASVAASNAAAAAAALATGENPLSPGMNAPGYAGKSCIACSQRLLGKPWGWARPMVAAPGRPADAEAVGSCCIARMHRDCLSRHVVRQVSFGELPSCPHCKALLPGKAMRMSFIDAASI